MTTLEAHEDTRGGYYVTASLDTIRTRASNAVRVALVESLTAFVEDRPVEDEKLINGFWNWYKDRSNEGAHGKL